MKIYIRNPDKYTFLCKCGKTFTSNNPRSKYCSKSCSKIKNRMYTEASCSKIGSINELLVSAEFMKSGYEVFKSINPGCELDFVVMKDGKLLKVESTTGYINASNKVQHPTKDIRRFDILAVITPNGLYCGYVVNDKIIWKYGI